MNRNIRVTQVVPPQLLRKQVDSRITTKSASTPKLVPKLVPKIVSKQQPVQNDIVIFINNSWGNFSIHPDIQKILAQLGKPLDLQNDWNNRRNPLLIELLIDHKKDLQSFLNSYSIEMPTTLSEHDIHFMDDVVLFNIPYRY